MNKGALIENLRHGVYCRLQPSPIAGIGLFAIRGIPRGVNPLGEYNMTFKKIPAEEISNDPSIPDAVKKYVEDMCVVEDGCIWMPTCGINNIHIDFFINHSSKPNMRHGERDYFYAIRAIRAGEELTVDYGTYNDERGF